MLVEMQEVLPNQANGDGPQSEDQIEDYEQGMEENSYSKERGKNTIFVNGSGSNAIYIYQDELEAIREAG